MNNLITWVRGNTLRLAVPLSEVTIVDGQSVKAPYTPPEGSTVQVTLHGVVRPIRYACSVDGNIVRIQDNGTLACDTYGIEITVADTNGRRLRSFRCGMLRIVECSDQLAPGEYLDTDTFVLDGSLFISGEQGPQGAAFTYEDFTPAQLEALRGPQGLPGRDGNDGAPIYTYFHVDEHMHLIGEPGTNRIRLNEHKHLIFDYD